MKPPGWINASEYSRIKKIMPLPCVDLLIFYARKMLLLKRNNPPLKNGWFTPGSRVLLGESLEEAVKRTLKEETGLTAVRIVQKDTMSFIFDELHAITTLYLVEVNECNVVLNDEHSEYKWVLENDADIHPYVKSMIKTSKIFEYLISCA
jgi:ADP-ribose pyrophosphatase YjhB (NUDIX family)